MTGLQGVWTKRSQEWVGIAAMQVGGQDEIARSEDTTKPGADHSWQRHGVADLSMPFGKRTTYINDK